MTHKNIVAIIGNPNCGKTTLFNVLTGAKQSVGNWPGVTVEKKTGGFNIDKREITLVDLPGIYSLQPSSSVSEDERVARDYVASSEAQAIINIVDASNLERNLYLTAQLLELQIPMVVVVNMLDVAKTHGLEINLEKLQDELGCPVVGIVASRKKGIEELKQALDKQLSEPEAAANPIVFSADIENAITKVGAILAKQAIPRSRWVAEQLVEGDAEILKVFPGISIDEAEPILQEIDAKYDGDVDMAMADVRYQFVSKVSQQSIVRAGQAGQTLTDKIDKIVLNRWLGIPIFLGVMYLMFIFAINIGSAFIDFFDILFGAIFIDGFGELLTYLGTPEWLKTILADGIGGGIQCVSTFVPVIACMFFALSFLEDSGYMARAAFVMDRFMRALGLPGKSFVPLIVGFGCGVPAIMASRTMEKKSDRITTVLMAPFMSCGARLPVYVLFATAFWPMNGQNLVFALYLIGIAVAVATGFMLKRTALKGESGAFLMEIPPYHLPTLRNLLLSTWDRLKGFVVRAGKVIVVLVAVLCFLNSLGTDGTFGNEDSDKSVLSQIGKSIVPVFKPMGIQEENWPAAVGVFTGILAKEATLPWMRKRRKVKRLKKRKKADLILRNPSKKLSALSPKTSVTLVRSSLIRWVSRLTPTFPMSKSRLKLRKLSLLRLLP
ncbi:Fe(2+) transporter permease subunit FeoB [uncultured Parasutterella sp.]|uniref:Fe(2+) transporter permease subunit FeoB n=1 Tax=uncultured Parasutterella sp. TaxID=1263098 RepID=UPI002595865B|nr:Fe(2+) transporter permease subunit FeoB [uncultured Parasutterella sp.]